MTAGVAGGAGTADVERIPGIEYAAPGGRALHLDLYRPTGRDDGAAAAAGVYFHGGGMVGGRRDDFADRLFGLATQGVAVASASYRLADEAGFPAQLHDARAAVRWLRRHGGRYGLATERIGVWGASGGATLALLTAYAPPPEGDDAGQSSVQAVVSWFGSSDHTDRGRSVRPADGTTVPASVLALLRRDGLEIPPPVPFPVRVLGAADVAEAQPRLPELSPLTYAARPGPPVLLMHGTRDGMVPADHSVWFRDAVTAAGGDARLLLLDGGRTTRTRPSTARSRSARSRPSCGSTSRAAPATPRESALDRRSWCGRPARCGRRPSRRPPGRRAEAVDPPGPTGLATGNYTIADLTELFSVSRPTVYRTLQRESGTTATSS